MATITVKNEVFHIPDSNSPCDLWRTYFTKLKSKMGKENAKTIWLMTWGAHSPEFCTTNADFNKWLKRNDIDVSNAATRAIADLSKIGGNILGLGKNMTKIVSVGAPILLGVVTIAITIIVINSSKKMTVADLVAAHPGGRAAYKMKGLKAIGT